RAGCGRNPAGARRRGRARRRSGSRPRPARGGLRRARSPAWRDGRGRRSWRGRGGERATIAPMRRARDCDRVHALGPPARLSGAGGWTRIARRHVGCTGGVVMRRWAIGLAGLALAAAAVAARGEVVVGSLELRWGAPFAPGEARALAPRFEATLVLDSGARIALDPDQARRGAGDLYALAGRRVAV